MRTPPIPARRGAAMPLVIISLGMATIMTAAFLTARDNSALLGENATESSSARWAATAAVDLGIAILETESDWRTAHVNGQLLDGYVLAGAEIDIELTDLETGDPPTADSDEIEMRASATLDGLTQTVVAVAHVATEERESVDVDLSEFAVFGEDEITVNGDATLARWPTAPMTGLGRRLAIGTQATAMGSVAFNGNGAGIDTTVYSGPGASDTLVTVGGGPAVAEVSLLDQIPVPAPPASSDGGLIGGFLDLSVAVLQTIASDVRYNSVTMGTGSSMTISGTTTVVSEGDFNVGRSATLSIDGDVTLVVYGDLIVNKGAIEVEPDASLTVHLDGQLVVINAYIGNERSAGEIRDNTGYASWMDVDRLQILSTPGNDGDWTLHMTSVVKANLYNRSQTVTLNDFSALYGRVLANRVVLNGSASLFYDHSLSDGNGFTNPDSHVFDETGHIVPSILNLLTLDDQDLSDLSDTLGVTVKTGGKEYSTNATSTDPPPSGPTPRPVPVQWEIVSYGMDMSTLEQ